MKDEDILCTCMGIRVEDIKKAMAEGASDLKQVQEVTGVGSVCGGCNDDTIADC